MGEKNTQKGFTIIELMIATTVFGIVLLVAATGVLAIGRMYYKGITASRAQETTRSVIETMSRTIQFSGEARTTGGSFPGAQSICFGYDRYTYTLNSQITDPNTIGLRYDKRTNLSNCSPINSGGTELLPRSTRLLGLEVTQVNSSTFRIHVKIAYGDNDLLSIYDNNGVPTGPFTIGSLRDAQCKPGIAASNFCAMSELETIVNKRVE